MTDISLVTGTIRCDIIATIMIDPSLVDNVITYLWDFVVLFIISMLLQQSKHDGDVRQIKDYVYSSFVADLYDTSSCLVYYLSRM